MDGCIENMESDEQANPDENQRQMQIQRQRLGAVTGNGVSSLPCALLDRSKVSILLCDNDPTSSEQILQILLRCSYNVTSASTARQVVTVLNSQEQDIDIILMEVDLPVNKGFKLLKYIIRKKKLHHIPVVMMSNKDEVSVVVQCLRLGAADYLVKPLRINELVHLWTHMWRRRRMLGLAEKDVLNCDPDLMASETSEDNSNSTTLLSSDDSSEKCRVHVTSESKHQELNSKSLAVVDGVETSVEHHFTSPGNEKPMRILSFPKKCELKIGESSAFFTYEKSRINKENSGEVKRAVTSNPSEHIGHWKCNNPCNGTVEIGTFNRGWKSYCHSDDLNGDIEGSTYMNFQVPTTTAACEAQPYVSVPPSSSKGHVGLSGIPSTYHLPFFFPTSVQSAFPLSKEIYGSNLPAQPQDKPVLPSYASSSCHLPAMPSLSYHTVGIELPLQNISAQNICPDMASSLKAGLHSCDRMNRREVALMKFRQKRKGRCFDKKIRYVNRKKLAEKRPRIRGQFVRQQNGVDVDLNGHPDISDSDDGDDDDDGSEDNEDDEECCM